MTGLYSSMAPDPETGEVDGRGAGRGTVEQAMAYRTELAQLGLGGPFVGGTMVVDAFREHGQKIDVPVHPGSGKSPRRL